MVCPQLLVHINYFHNLGLPPLPLTVPGKYDGRRRGSLIFLQSQNFLRKVFHLTLATRVNLLKRQIVEEGWCVCCGMQYEIKKHIFFNSSRTKKV